MLTSSAALALVLQCATPLQPSPLHSVSDTDSPFKLDASGIHGDVSPYSELPARSAARSIKRAEAEYEQRAFSKDLAYPVVIPLHLAEADLDQPIVPGIAHSLPVNPVSAAAQSAPPPPPTYESWDVLRQYPRAGTLTPPAAQAPKSSDTPKTSKESKDAQSKSTTTPQQN